MQVCTKLSEYLHKFASISYVTGRYWRGLPKLRGFSFPWSSLSKELWALATVLRCSGSMKSLRLISTATDGWNDRDRCHGSLLAESISQPIKSVAPTKKVISLGIQWSFQDSFFQYGQYDPRLLVVAGACWPIRAGLVPQSLPLASSLLPPLVPSIQMRGSASRPIRPPSCKTPQNFSPNSIHLLNTLMLL